MSLLSTHQKLGLARLAHRAVRLWRGWRREPMRAEFVRGGLRWALDLDEGIDFSIFLLGAFEPETVRTYQRLLKPGQVALDIGANIGAHTLPLAQAVGARGQVHAFEPTRYAFQKLQANVALNPAVATAIQARQILLSAVPQAAVPAAICSGWPLAEDGRELHPEHGGEPHGTEGAWSATLDEALPDLARLDFIKLDVDGHELAVLQGGRGLLRKFEPPILIELCPHVCVEQGHTFAELVVCLTELGYGFFSLKEAPLPRDAAGLERLIPRGGGLNVLARVRR